MNTAAAKHKPAVELDLTPQVTVKLNGVASPGPLVAVKQVLNELPSGQVLVLITDFASIDSDLKVWAKQTNNTVVRVDKNDPRGQTFYILKGDPWPVSKVLNAMASNCPTPVLFAKKHLVGMKNGEVLKLITNCTTAPIEIDSWIRATTHHLLGMVEDVYGFYRFYIQK